MKLLLSVHTKEGQDYEPSSPRGMVASFERHLKRESYSVSITNSLLRSRSGRSHATLPVPTRLLQTDTHSFLFCVALLFAPTNEPRLLLSLYTLHQSQETLCFFRGKTLAACDVLWKVMGETPKKVVESSNKCFICSSIPTSKNKIYIFGKTSTDLAGLI